jgi:hypothetical protein
MTEPTKAEREPLDRRVLAILLSWGLAVLALAGLFSFWTQRNQREDAREREQIQVEQDRAMCELTGFFTSSGTTPPPGPEGDREREGIARMTAYRATLRCDQLPAPSPR